MAEYVGGYSDWLRHGHRLTEADNPVTEEAKKKATAERRKSATKTKLSYKDQRELDQLPRDIEAIENTIATLQTTLAAPDFYAQEKERVQQALQQLSDAEALLEQRVERWGQLETMRESLK